MVNMLSADLMARSWRNASTLTSSLPLAPHICVFVGKVDPPPPQFHQLHLKWCKSIFNLGDTLVMGYPKQAGYSLCDCIAKRLNASSLVSNRLQQLSDARRKIDVEPFFSHRQANVLVLLAKTQSFGQIQLTNSQQLNQHNFWQNFCRH